MVYDKRKKAFWSLIAWYKQPIGDGLDRYASILYGEEGEKWHVDKEGESESSVL